MKKNNSLLKNYILNEKCSVLGLDLEPAPGGIAVSAASMEEKRFQHQLSILKGYLALAQAGQAPGTPVDPAGLPREEGPDALLAVWYDRFLQADSTRSRLVTAYNAFGALSGGFPALEKNLERWLGQALGGKLMTYVNVVRQDGDELDGLVLEVPSWSQEELEAVEQGILAAARGGFSA